MTNPEVNLQEVGSVGSPGIEHRSYDRYYLNSPWGTLTNIDRISQAFRMSQSVLRRSREQVTRCVGRFLVTERALEDLNSYSQIRDAIEVVMPTTELVYFGLGERQRIYMLMASLNTASRNGLVERNYMIQATEEDRRFVYRSPREQVEAAREQGYGFVSSISSEHIDTIQGLWGRTFGWSRSGVEARAQTLRNQGYVSSNARQSWFSGLIDAHGHLVAAAVAERLDMSVGFGRAPLPLVESSEWRRQDAVSQHGLMAATVSYLHAQVLRDVPNAHIFAETNFRTRAHRVGFAAGMEVPERNVCGMRVPQILVQNVEVGDGLDPEGLRDFTLLHVSQVNRERFYSSRDLSYMLSGGVL